MPVTGIESILCVQYQHFEPFLFCDSPVIVDACDFATYYNGKDILYNLCGGEYLALAVEWNRILGSLQQCHLDPLFVFSVGSEKRGQQIPFETFGFYKKLACFKRLLNGEATDYLNSANPVLLNSTLVDLLDAIHVSHLCSTFSSPRSCASLANRMHCPLLASAHEYLLLCTELPHLSYTGFSFIPLQCVYPEPVRLLPGFGTDKEKKTFSSKSTASFGLASHKFLPNNAGLELVPTFYRPLLFLLLGTDSLPRIRLPKPVLDLMNKVKGNDYKSRRWHAIISWLRNFRSGSMQPIDQIYNSYPADEKELAMKNLADCLQTYVPDKYIGRRLSSLLLESPVPKDTPQDLQTDMNSSRIQLLDKNAMDSGARTKVNAVLTGAKIDDKLRNLDFTKDWPKKLADKFNQSKLENFVFCAMYGSEGVILPIVVENVSAPASIWDASLRLRSLHYRYLAGLELKLGQFQKIIGPMCAIEYARHAEKVIRRRIPIEPSYIKPTENATDTILVSCLGIPFTDNIPPLGTLLSLVVSLTAWYQWEMTCQTVHAPFTQSPTGLAVLLCAVVNQFNFQKLDDSLVKHYESCSFLAEKDIGFLLPVNSSKPHSISSSFSVDHVHQYNAIQGIYACLRSAVVLLDQLLPDNRHSKFLQFPPSWEVFPSGRLTHGVAACLARSTPTSRLHMCVHLWLPHLLRVSSSRAESSELRRTATVLFEQAVDATTTLLNSAVSGSALDFVDETVEPPDVTSFRLKQQPPVRFAPAATDKTPEHIQSSADVEKARQQSPARLANLRAAHAAHLGQNNGSLPSNLGSAHTVQKKHSTKKVFKSPVYSEKLKKRLETNG